MNIKAANDRAWGLKFHQMYSNDWTCAVDIGANEGQFSRLYCKLFNTVTGFDPNLDRLKKNLKVAKRFSNYTFYPIGMYDREVTKKFYKFHTHHGLSSLDYQYAEENLTRYRKEDVVTEDYVQLRQLDDFNLRPSFIKIDVEGVANNVIIGALDTINNFKPTIQIEKGFEKKLLSWLGYVPVSFFSDNHKKFSDSIYVHKSKVNLTTNLPA